MRPGGQDSADSGRLLAIGLAFALPLAAWIGLEYGREPEPSAQPVRPVIAAEPAPPPESELTADQPPVMTDRGKGRLFRCERDGRTVYTDHPDEHCADARARPLEGPPPTAGLSPDRPFQTQLAELEARRPPPPDRAAFTAPERPETGRPDRCAFNAREQDRVKSALRQPHEAASGDALNRQLRQLTDEAFRLRC